MSNDSIKKYRGRMKKAMAKANKGKTTLSEDLSAFVKKYVAGSKFKKTPTTSPIKRPASVLNATKRAKQQKNVKGQGQSSSGITGRLTRVRDSKSPLGSTLMVTGKRGDPIVRRSPDSLANRKKALAKSKLVSKGKDKKTFKDYTSIAAAKRAGSLYYMGKDGKKKAAVTKADLSKSGLSLRDYLNKKLGKVRRGK